MVTWAHRTPHTISIKPAVSSGLTLHYPYTLQWDGPFLIQKLPFRMGEEWEGRVGQTPIQNTVTVNYPIPHAKRHLDLSSRFCRIPVRYITDGNRQRQTHTHGPHHTSVAIGRIYAMHTMRPKNATRRPISSFHQSTRRGLKLCADLSTCRPTHVTHPSFDLLTS